MELQPKILLHIKKKQTTKPKKQCLPFTQHLIHKLFKTNFKNHDIGWAQWLTPVILALWEAEAGRSSEVRSLRPT